MVYNMGTSISTRKRKRTPRTCAYHFASARYSQSYRFEAHNEHYEGLMDEFNSPLILKGQIGKVVQL